MLRTADSPIRVFNSRKFVLLLGGHRKLFLERISLIKGKRELRIAESAEKMRCRLLQLGSRCLRGKNSRCVSR